MRDRRRVGSSRSRTRWCGLSLDTIQRECPRCPFGRKGCGRPRIANEQRPKTLRFSFVTSLTTSAAFERPAARHSITMEMWGTNSPGHLVYLIDQSGSMGGQNEIKAAEAVHEAIFETFRGCVMGKEVRNRVYITIIGYGNEDGVSIIRQGWMSDFVADLKACRANGTTIIAPKSYGWTPMTEAFQLARKCLQTWISTRQSIMENDSHAGLPAPIVINITDGCPDDMPSATAAAQALMQLSTPYDGNVLLFNIHMDDSEDSQEIKFPNDRAQLDGDTAGQFLFDISSNMIPEFIQFAKFMKIEGIFPGARGFVVNAKGDTLVRFVRFGSGVSQFHSI